MMMAPRGRYRTGGRRPAFQSAEPCPRQRRRKAALEVTLGPALAKLVAKDWRRPHWRVLYYHAVLPEEQLTFADQLDWFSAHFTWCSISEGVTHLENGSIERPLLSLTFDDADRTLVDVVVPLLSERRITACVYVVPTYVERGVSYRDEKPRPIMSWNDLRNWLAAGHEVGSHSYTHAPLPRCTPQRLVQEARWSRDSLEQKLSASVEHFAYPWGQHNGEVKRIIAEAGPYRSIATILRGGMHHGHDPLSLRRDRGLPGEPVETVLTTMRLADRLYFLRRLRRRRSRVYWERHPEERFDALSEVYTSSQIG